MTFPLESEHRLLIEAARSFVRNRLVPFENEVKSISSLSPEMAKELTAKRRDASLYVSDIPAEVGVAGLTALEAALLDEDFGATTDILIRRSLEYGYEARDGNSVSRSLNSRWFSRCWPTAQSMS